MEHKLLATTRKPDGGLVACDLLGNVQAITVNDAAPDATYFTYRPDPKACTVYGLRVLDQETFEQLCANLKEQITDESTLYVYTVGTLGIDIKQDGYRSEVFYGSSGRVSVQRWKCMSSRCKAHNHYHCEHAQFAASIVPVKAVEYQPGPDDFSDLIDTY